MDLVKLEMDVPKEIHEVGIAIRDILIATDNALKDGFQVGQDLPIILSAAFGSLVVAITGMQNIPTEFKELPVKASLALALPIADGIEALIRK